MSTTKKKTAKKAAKKTGKKTGRKGAGRDTKASRAAARKKSQEFTADRLAKRLTAGLLDELKDMSQPWNKTPEAEQSVIIARITDTVRNATKEAVQVIAAQGVKGVVGTLFQVTVKEGVRATLVVPPGTDRLHDLADHATKDVVIVLSDPEKFMKGLDEIKPDKDQKDLL